MDFCLEQIAQLYVQIMADFVQLEEKLGEGYPEGWIIYKKARRRLKHREVVYTYPCLETIVLVGKKRRRKQTHIRKKDRERVLTLVKERNLLRRERNAARKGATFLRKLLRQRMSETEFLALQEQAAEEWDRKSDVAIHRTAHRLAHCNLPEYKVMTANGELVRSKNECIVADLLCKIGFLYAYEQELTLHRDGRSVRVHPDFVVYCKGKKVYVEFLGMMDTPEYVQNWEAKKLLFAQNNIKLGKNLVCLVCHNPTELDAQRVEAVLWQMKAGNLPQELVDVGLQRTFLSSKTS